MPEILPFHGVLYDPARVNPATVLTQPYDKVTAAMRERYLGLSPYNLVRIELGKEEPGDTAAANKYTRARDCVRDWLAAGILRRSATPAFYCLEQTFAAPGNPASRLTRRGLIGRVRLHRWDEGRVLPHERTLSKPKADRLELLRTCGAQQGQIFMLHPPVPGTAALPRPDQLGAPVLDLVDDYDVHNRLWAITDPATLRAIQAQLAPRAFYIADGHHRYETALAFRDECRAAHPEAGPEAPWEFVMATVVDMTDPGLVILPTHRAVGNLRGFEPRKFRAQLAATFNVEPKPGLPALLAGLGRGAIGMADTAGLAVLRPRDPATLTPLFAGKPPLWDRLDVAVLHVAILEAQLGIDEARLREEANVTYWREADTALAEVRNGHAQLAFFLSPTPVTDVQAVADARSRMPQKSTDFYPKLLSGLVMYDVAGNK